MKKLLGKYTYSIHKWCGLVAGIFILIMGLSGAFLVFHDDLEALEHRELWQVNNSRPVSIDKAYRSISGQYPNWEMRLQRFSDRPSETLIFSLRRPDRRLLVFAHPSGGKILKVLNPEKTLGNWLLTLHYSLHAKLAGKVLVLLIGFVFLISLITGLVVYRKSFLKMLFFRTEFKRKNKRAVASSLHRYVGFWALLLNLLMVTSGLFISFDIVKNGFKSAVAPAANPESPAVTFSIDEALERLKQSHPDFEPSYMRFPKGAGQPLIINGRVAGEPFYYSRFYNAAAFDSETGSLASLKLNATASASLQLDSIFRAVHFVEFGNWLVKLLFFVVGLSAPLLSITGFLLWQWKKKTARKRFVKVQPFPRVQPGANES